MEQTFKTATALIGRGTTVATSGAVDDLPADYWSSQECPSESFETVIYPSIIGNHVPDVEWKAEIRAHHYDFDLDEWTVFTLAERFYNSSNYTGTTPTSLGLTSTPPRWMRVNSSGLTGSSTKTERGSAVMSSGSA